LRLDVHGLEGKDPVSGKWRGKPEWHWNTNETDILRKIDINVANHTPSKFAKFAGKSLTVIRYAGKAFLVTGIASSAYEIYAAEDRAKEIVIQVGGWTGAWIGAWAGGKAGAAGGGVVGSAFAGVGAGPGAIGGGVFGAIGGGAAGWWIGSEVTETIYERWFTPIQKEEYVIACIQENQNAGGDL